MTKNKFNYIQFQAKWDKRWRAWNLYHPDLETAKRPFYNLMMFPYPSAEGLHVGNMYAFTGSDVFGRFKRMQGYDVFEPIGLDGFGIHSENYALKIGAHPARQAMKSEKRFYEQLKLIGNAFDFERTVETYKPDYYKWTQWLFIQLFKAGLAQKKKAEVNWCPSCKTVLADEQVIQKSKVKSSTYAKASADKQKLKVDDSQYKFEKVEDNRVGVCERCETEVVKKELEQWFFNITKYSERLLNDTKKIDWSKKVILAQKNWIGRSEGSRIKFKVESEKLKVKELEVFTTRPDTLFGATFMVLSPKHELVTKFLAESRIKNQESSEIREYVEEANKKTDSKREDKEKTGIFSGLFAINPVNNKRIPIWIADYVVMEYGTGAIMAVPAHDERDFEFAKKYELPILSVIEKPKSADKYIECYENHGKIINSDDWNGWDSKKDFHKILKWLGEKNIGTKETRYHLRDWLISRQRYWGPPIPMVFCQSCADERRSWFNSQDLTENRIKDLRFKNKENEKNYKSSIINHQSPAMAGWFPVPESDLPVELPFIKNFKPIGSDESPLGQDKDFVNTTCPKCSGPAKRETDVSDTFLDSSWYFLRYPATDLKEIPFPSKNWKKYLQSDGRKSKIEDRALKIEDGGSINSQLSTLKHQPSTIHDLSSNLKLEIENSAKRTMWLPVNMYIGGAEHSVLHLLYSRFITKALFDMGFLDFSSKGRPASGWDEPFTKFRAHGLIVRDGAKMSKSKGNIVNPDEYIAKYGADTLRCYLMFLGPFQMGGDFRDSGIEGMERFLKRFKRLVKEESENRADSAKEVVKALDKAVMGIGADIENLRYNTAIAKLMTLTNILTENKGKISIESLKTYVLLIAPFAPYLAEELWDVLSNESARIANKSIRGPVSLHPHPTSSSADRRTAGARRGPPALTTPRSVHLEPWPTFDKKNIVEEKVTVAIQVNGKLRATIKIMNNESRSKEYVEGEAGKSNNVRKYLEGKSIKKVIYIPGKIINFVV